MSEWVVLFTVGYAIMVFGAYILLRKLSDKA